MTSKTFTDHRALVLSYELREAMLGIINTGVYCGFDTVTKTSTGVTISHDKTGIRKNLENWDLSNPTGVYITRFGTVVHEENPVEVTIGGEVKEGLYILVAYYQRPYVGTTVPVKFPITYTVRPAEDENDLSGLNQYDTPLLTIRITGDGTNRTYTIGSVPGSADMKSAPGLSKDDINSAGVRGVGKYIDLGKILKYLDDWLKEKDRMDLNILAKLGIPDYDGNQDPENPGELPTSYNFILAAATVWYNLYIIDTQLKALWDKLGFPEKQPEGETILDTLKTVWENFVALKAYLNEEDNKIWDRLGYPEKATGVNWISVSKTVWENLVALDNHIKEYSDQTDSSIDDINNYISGDLAQDLSIIYATLGYKLNGEQTEPAMTSVSKTKSIWQNLVDLQNELQAKYDDLYQSNDFRIYMPTVTLGSTTSNAPTLPSDDVFKALVVDLKNTQRNGTNDINFVKLPTDVNTSRNQIIFVTFGEGIQEGDASEVNGKSIIIPDVRVGNTTTSVVMYLGGWCLLSKTKGEGFWRLHARNAGKQPSGNATPGMMGGTDVVGSYQCTYSGESQYINISSTTGLTIIDHQAVFNAAVNKFGWTPYDTSQNGVSRFGRYRAVLKIADPTEDQEGYEKVIRLIGNQHSARFAHTNDSDCWMKVLWSAALGSNIVDPAVTFSGSDYWENGPHRPYIKYPGDWIRIKAINYEGNGLKWVLIDQGFSNPNILMWSNAEYNSSDRGITLGYSGLYFVLPKRGGGTTDKLNYMVVNTYPAHKYAWGNGCYIGVKDDMLNICLPVQCWGGPSASGDYVLNPVLPPVAGSYCIQFRDTRGSSGLQWYINSEMNVAEYRNKVTVNDIDNGVFDWNGSIPLMMGAGAFDWMIYEQANKNYT